MALLAQTCSQIGADTSPTKPSSSSNEKCKRSSVVENARFSPVDSSETHQQVIMSNETKLSLKPCEINVVVKKLNSDRAKCSVQEYMKGKIIDKCNSERQTASPTTNCTPNFESVKTTPEQNLKTLPTKCASPIVGFGNDILQDLDHLKDAVSCNISAELPSSNNSHSNPCCSSSLEQTNPAFRSTFPGAPFNFNQQSVLFSSGYTGTSPGPYSNYVGVKTPTRETLLPLCKDPYCAGCQFNLHNQQFLLNGVCGSCPSGCNQCDHQKYNLAMTIPFNSATVPSPLTYTSVIGSYICNWISGDTYCGKRFVRSEELLQHLRSHNAGIDTISVATSSVSSFLNPIPLITSTSLHRPGYLNSVNSLSPVRYHPYNKGMLQTLIGSSYNTFNPTVFAPYLSPYTVYSQRVSTAAVHP